MHITVSAITFFEHVSSEALFPAPALDWAALEVTQQAVRADEKKLRESPHNDHSLKTDSLI
jgi:hypothetical protein